jgi:hypothetical protein
MRLLVIVSSSVACTVITTTNTDRSQHQSPDGVLSAPASVAFSPARRRLFGGYSSERARNTLSLSKTTRPLQTDFVGIQQLRVTAQPSDQRLVLACLQRSSISRTDGDVSGTVTTTTLYTGDFQYHI